MDDVESIIAHNLENCGLCINARQKAHSVTNALMNNDYGDKDVQQLFKMIVEVIDNKDGQFVSVLHKGIKLYRARKVDLDNTKNTGIEIDDRLITSGFDDINSREAPLGIANAGRTNMRGVSYLYASDNEQTACSEIKTRPGSVISIAEFELVQDLSVVNMNTDKKSSIEQNRELNMSIGEFFEQIMFLFTIEINDDNDYIPTQIIAEQFRKQGVDGVIYRSFYSEDNNYSIFNCGEHNIKFNGSRLVTHQYSNQVFWDYNNKCEFSGFSSDYVKFNPEYAQIQLQRIKNKLASEKGNEHIK